MITITEPAREYLIDLLAKQEDGVKGIRIFINDPGTPRAETCIAYCRSEDIKSDDSELEFTGLKAWFDKRSEPFLDEAVVDFSSDRMGGQLTIRAPNAKLPRVDEDSSLEDRINYLLWNEVNPQLASHGGEVRLVEIFEGDTAILQFGGGCQGCGMVDVTLKDGVETTLIEGIPELKAVRDVTDHTQRENAYFT